MALYLGNKKVAGGSNDGIPHWIQASNVLENKVGSSVTIPCAWEEVEEFAFRILGNNSSRFGYYVIPRLLWHNNGSYALFLTPITRGSEDIGYMNIVVQNKTSNSFDIAVTGTDCSNVMVLYKKYK